MILNANLHVPEANVQMNSVALCPVSDFQWATSCDLFFFSHF